MENVAYKLFVYHSEDNMIFLIWPEEMALSCSWYHISVQSLWDGCLLLSLPRQADGLAVCQFMQCVHVSQSRWTLRQNRDLSPKHSSSRPIFFLPPEEHLLISQGSQNQGFLVKTKSREIIWENFNEVIEDSLKRQQNEPWRLLSGFISLWHANPPVFNMRVKEKMGEPRQRMFPLAYSHLISLDCMEPMTRTKGMAGEMKT